MEKPTDTFPCLFIPDDSTSSDPVQPRTVWIPPGKQFDDVVCNHMLRCRRRDQTILYSEYHEKQYEGKKATELPEQFILYEEYMDDNAVAARSPNSRAARLLAQPRSHGPIIVIKMNAVANRKTGEVKPLEFLPLDASELESKEFQQNRLRFEKKKREFTEKEVAKLLKQPNVILWNTDTNQVHVT